MNDAPAWLRCHHSFVCRLFWIFLRADSGGQEVHASITSSTQPSVTCRHCHAEVVFISFVFCFLFVPSTYFIFFRSEHTHTHIRTATVFSMNCGQQSACRRLPCVKFALSCRSERRLVLVRPNSWIRRLSPLLEQICLITRFCGKIKRGFDTAMIITASSFNEIHIKERHCY